MLSNMFFIFEVILFTREDALGLSMEYLVFFQKLVLLSLLFCGTFNY